LLPIKERLEGKEEGQETLFLLSRRKNRVGVGKLSSFPTMLEFGVKKRAGKESYRHFSAVFRFSAGFLPLFPLLSPPGGRKKSRWRKLSDVQRGEGGVI